MKSIRSLLLSALAVVSVASLSAQTTPAPAAPAPKAVMPAPAPAPAPTQVPVTRLAYVNSQAFTESATGLKQLVRAMQSLELEFSGQQQELSLLGEKLRTLVTELNKLNADQVANAEAIKTKQADGQKMQQELQAKQQAAQQAYNQRAQEVQGPVLEEIGKALRVFAEERDIGMLFDVSKMGDAVLDAKPELDLTADFIGYYNKLHP